MPRLRSHTNIHRHIYRGKLWFVLQDRASGRFHRFTPEAYRLIAMMDGKRSLDEIWEMAVDQLEIDAVTQDELVQLTGQLYTADVLAGNVPPDIVELSERGRRQVRQKIVRSVLNPLALRFPLLDPDSFLSATMPLFRPLYSILGVLLFFGVSGYGLVLAVLNWEPLTDNVFDRVTTAENLMLLLISYPMIKALHELGHAYTIKRWGGSVHEIGIMFLVFMPVPYVDASDSIAFSSKWRRALVGGAGILVEIFVASLAMMVWAGAEEGLVRAFAFNIMLIGGVSTLLFNGNPLLRFDGYYVLCDLLEIPNLGKRANKYLGYLVQRYAFGSKWADNPVTGRNESVWFVTYGISAFIYRLFITFSIVGLVATRFFIIGVILALWTLFLMLILPLLKGGWFVLASPVLRRHRGRALTVTCSVIGLFAAALLLVPLPHNTIAQGVVDPAPEAFSNATSDGIVTELFVSPGQLVRKGDPLMKIEDPLIEARRAVLVSRAGEIKRRLDAEALFDQTAKRILEEELDSALGDLNLTETRIAEQTVRARVDGKVILPVSTDLLGRFVRRGELLAVVAQFENPLIRVVVPEEQADLVRRDTRALHVRFLGDEQEAHPAKIVRTTPTLTRSLPSRALSTQGGGRMVLDPSARPGQIRALKPVYRLDISLVDDTAVGTYGDRVHVRFAHDDAPLAGRIYRAATRVFLKFFASKRNAS
jgi:putative peptide zinc metalloprotease protein